MNLKDELIFKYLSCKTKKDILIHLYICQCQNCCVDSLCKITNSKQSNISKHLIDLKNSRVVQWTKNSKFVQYHLSQEFKDRYGELMDFVIKTNGIENCNC